MTNIKLFKELFPVDTLRGNISILEIKDMDWYLNCMRSKYYNRYNLTKYSSEQEEYLVNHMKSLIDNSLLEIDTDEELRFIFKVKDVNIGGGSLSSKDGDSETVILSYFIIPEYQGKHYAGEMLEGIIKLLSNTQYKYAEAHIQLENKGSVKVVKRLNFEKYIRYKYSTCKVDYYRLEISR